MASVALARIDSRLIHGQVVAKWLKSINAGQIVVVDDTLANDPFMSSIYSMAVPQGCKVRICTIEQAVAEWQENQLGYSSETMIMLFKDVRTALAAWQQGLTAFTQLQVGGLGGGPARKVVYKNITLDKKDCDDLVLLSNGGVQVIFQTVPEDTPGKLENIIKSMNM